MIRMRLTGPGSGHHSATAGAGWGTERKPLDNAEIVADCRHGRRIIAKIVGDCRPVATGTDDPGETETAGVSKDVIAALSTGPTRLREALRQRR